MTEKLFESRFISKALGLPLSEEGPVSFSAICTDSRKITPGCFFIPLKGDRFDAHDFILQALEQGAAGALCNHSFGGLKAALNLAHARGAALFEVDDTLTAYRSIAHAWRSRFQIPVVAVAGAVGKTTTKEFLAAILRGKWPETLQTQGSENGFIGIPLTLLQLREHHQAAVIEIGIDEIGAMKSHLPLVEPQASIVTAIGPEHLENLRDLETVTREECLALTWVAEHGGFISINGDDSYVGGYFSEWRNQTGKKLPLHFLEYGLGIRPGPTTLTGVIAREQLTITPPSGISFSLFVPLPGAHNARNLLGAVALALGLGLTPEEIATGLKSFKGIYGRSDLKKIGTHLDVLCDYYNANPTSVEAALDVVHEKTAHTEKNSTPKRRWVCLGDMLELGPNELAFHTSLSNKLCSVLNQPSDEILLFGPRMKSLASALKGRFSGRARHFSTHEDLAKALEEATSVPSFVLIKGSRGMKMEEIWKLFEKFAKKESGNEY